MKAQVIPAPEISGSRVQKLRDRIINAPQEVCIERARYLTRSMARHWEEHPLTRMSMALENILGNISVIIRDGVQFVGCRTSNLKGAPLFPENKVRWIAGDAENFDKRVEQRALIAEAEKHELIDHILPFWNDKTVEEYFESLLSGDVAEDMDKYVFTFMLEITYGIGHFTMNQGRVLSMGLQGIMNEASRKYEALPTGDKVGDKGIFFQSVIRSLGAAIHFAERYAALAQDMAVNESDPERAQELMEIARVCRKVPGQPAETFHEAVQSVYFIHLIAQIETGGNSISLGRIDQTLYPYYKQDLEAGRITPETAQELLSLMFIKVNEIWNVLEEAYIPGGEGTEGKTTQNVTVGGLGPDGKDATNALSYLGMAAYADIRTVQPNFGVRLHSGSSDDFFSMAVAYAQDGVLMHFFNDKAIVKSLVQAGHSLEDARDYGVVGCLEPNAQGKAFGSTFAVQFNGIKCLEFALSNGVDNIFGYQSGIHSGDPTQFKSFDDLWNAYDSQVSHFVKQFVRGIACLDQAIAEMLPSPFASAMIDGPMEKGLDLTKGGAIYNSTGVQFMGFSNVADSLFAIKKAVFDDKRFTLEEISQWLAEDWDEALDKKTYFFNKIPKYGNDISEVDAMAARVVDHFADKLAGHSNYRGGAFWPGIFSVGFHLAMGAFTAATPDGRAAGDVLGNGITPSNGVAISGPTAVMNSVTRLPLSRIHNGMNLNMRFTGRRTKTENVVALIRGYFKKGGFQVQFNVVDSDVLEKAQGHPEQYRDLIVRISGYSGIFVNLSDIAQDEIINRYRYEI